MEITKRMIKIGTSIGITIDKCIRGKFGVGDEAIIEFKGFRKKQNEKTIKKDINS